MQNYHISSTKFFILLFHGVSPPERIFRIRPCTYIHHSCTCVVTPHMSSGRMGAADLRTWTREKCAGEAMWTMCFQVEPFQQPWMLGDSITEHKMCRKTDTCDVGGEENGEEKAEERPRAHHLRHHAAWGSAGAVRLSVWWLGGEKVRGWAESRWDGKLDTPTPSPLVFTSFFWKVGAELMVYL